jgi:hypothetical protein
MKSNAKLIVYSLLLLSLIGYSFLWAIYNPSIIGMSLESSFRLSPESRLPKWFSIPSGYDRKDLTVQIYYYLPLPPVIYDFKAELLGPPPSFRILDKKTGMHRWHPDSERRGYQSNPGYVIGSINGVDEVIEHKAMEPIFYISDDQKLIDEIKRTK